MWVAMESVFSKSRETAYACRVEELSRDRHSPRHSVYNHSLQFQIGKISPLDSSPNAGNGPKRDAAKATDEPIVAHADAVSAPCTY